MDKDATSHVAFDEFGETGPCRVQRLVRRQTLRLVSDDQPFVFEEDAQASDWTCDRNPVEAAHEDRRPAPSHKCRIANNPPADLHQSGHDRFAGESARHGAFEGPAQFGGEPTVKRNHRVLADHDGHGLH